MNDHQQQGMNEAARQFTDTLVRANKATPEGTVEAQRLGAQLTEYFFNTVSNNLRTQAEGTRRVTQHLADRQQLAQEATRQLTRASVDTYKDFLDSMFFFYQGGTSRAKIRTEEAERRAEDAERRVEEAEGNAKEAQRRAEQADGRVEQAEKSAEEARKQAQEAEGRVEEAQRRAAEDERRAEEAEGRVDEANSRVERAEKRTEEAERRAEEVERRAERAERSAEEANRRAEAAEGRLEEAERRAEEAERRIEEAQRRAEEAEREGSEALSQGGNDLPLSDYDSLNVRQISERLDGLGAEQIERVREYEAANKNRSTLVNRLNSRLEASS